ncbi:uncharacterized protein L969DRAFT_89567 [Mixia osmundae IAM 14324]|uniref:uncharacterized protein n=1 Tax=Mixia osmundae (strain CBS 9802 / IAM 14324 / JCM 22182 / KY 12970) TaxID=764103 RepID=UPI0004A54E56|nr:uncharacterized protein L969DRAFT_89567 [Mixia osmundae IAM 14324]KEI37609.1 hypothetical protein L969DRAFT_89567 [Mixia osmundae IAM 14324]
MPKRRATWPATRSTWDIVPAHIRRPRKLLFTAELPTQDIVHQLSCWNIHELSLWPWEALQAQCRRYKLAVAYDDSGDDLIARLTAHVEQLDNFWPSDSGGNANRLPPELIRRILRCLRDSYDERLDLSDERHESTTVAMPTSLHAVINLEATCRAFRRGIYGDNFIWDLYLKDASEVLALARYGRPDTWLEHCSKAATSRFKAIRAVAMTCENCQKWRVPEERLPAVELTRPSFMWQCAGCVYAKTLTRAEAMAVLAPYEHLLDQIEPYQVRPSLYRQTAVFDQRQGEDSARARQLFSTTNDGSYAPFVRIWPTAETPLLKWPHRLDFFVLEMARKLILSKESLDESHTRAVEEAMQVVDKRWRDFMERATRLKSITKTLYETDPASKRWVAQCPESFWRIHCRVALVQTKDDTGRPPQHLDEHLDDSWPIDIIRQDPWLVAAGGMHRADAETLAHAFIRWLHYQQAAVWIINTRLVDYGATEHPVRQEFEGSDVQRSSWTVDLRSIRPCLLAFVGAHRCEIWRERLYRAFQDGSPGIPLGLCITQNQAEALTARWTRLDQLAFDNPRQCANTACTRVCACP